MFDIEQTDALWVDRGGEGTTTYLLLHGGGANGDVWIGLRDIIKEKEAGQWIIPDILGHGRSPWSNSYSIGEFASSLAPIVRNSKRLIIAGHSMGGTIGLALASGWYGFEVAGVMTIGTIANWTEKMMEKNQEYMDKPTRIFQIREEAREHYMMVAGLTGLVKPNSSILDYGIAAMEDGYGLAADINILQSSGIPIGNISGSAQCPIRLTCGSNDPMVSVDELSRYDPDAVEIPDTAHNSHVENPDTIWQIIDDFKRNLGDHGI